MAGPMRLGDDELAWSDFYRQAAQQHMKKGLPLAALGDQHLQDQLRNQATGTYMQYGFADPDTLVANPYTPDSYSPTKQAWHPSGTANEVVAGAENRAANRQAAGQERQQDAMSAQDPGGQMQRARLAYNATDPMTHPQQATQIMQDAARLQNPLLHFATNPDHAGLIDTYTNAAANNWQRKQPQPQQQQLSYDYMNPFFNEVS